MRMHAVLLLSSLWAVCSSQNYYQTLMEYLENRFLAIEERMELWHEQSNRLHAELQDFRRFSADTMERLGRERSTLGDDLEETGVHVDRLEHQLEYLTTQNAPRPCVNLANGMVEQLAWSPEERREGAEEDEGWVEEDSRVSDCVDVVSNIRSVKILKKVGSPKGMWTRDPHSAKVYIFNGTVEDTLYQFSSLLDLSTSTGLNHSRPIELPFVFNSLGSAVYNGNLYYIREEAGQDLQVVKYNLLNGSVTETAIFPGDSRAPIYSLNPETIVDLVADDEGLWALYAVSDWEPNINLAKLDRDTLDIEQMWDTRCPRQNAEAAFMVCGTVYVVYNTKQPSRSRVQCVFDINDKLTSGEAPLLYFPRRYGAHASLKYNPQEKQLYGWDDGYQILYRLALKRKTRTMLSTGLE